MDKQREDRRNCGDVSWFGRGADDVKLSPKKDNFCSFDHKKGKRRKQSETAKISEDYEGYLF